jgi:hypothetical protein
MKIGILILSFVVIQPVHAQIGSYSITHIDTIKLPDLSFKRLAALHLDEATILIEYKIFSKQLTSERKGMKKQIRSRKHLLKHDYNPIVTAQLRFYEVKFDLVDSIYSISKKNNADTFHVNCRIAPFQDFLASELENNQCIVLDIYNRKQNFIIKKSGYQRTGQMTSVGSTFYFLPGATKYFLTEMNSAS